MFRANLKMNRKIVSVFAIAVALFALNLVASAP